MARKQALQCGQNNGELIEVSASDLDGLDSVRTVKVRCKNTTGATITQGSLVRERNGFGDGTFFFIEPVTGASEFYLGIADTDILNNGEGEVIIIGRAPYDTSPYAPGTQLYYNFDGSIVTAKPLEDHIFIGITIDSLVAGLISIPREAGFYESKHYKPSGTPDNVDLTIPSGNQAIYCGVFTIGANSVVTKEANAELCIL